MILTGRTPRQHGAAAFLLSKSGRVQGIKTLRNSQRFSVPDIAAVYAGRRAEGGAHAQAGGTRGGGRGKEAADIADEYSDKAERAIEKTGSRPRCRPEGPRPTPATGGIREPTCSRPFPPFCSSCPATPLIQRPPSCGR